MKIYTVINDETDYREDFHSLTAAKQAMRELEYWNHYRPHAGLGGQMVNPYEQDMTAPIKEVSFLGGLLHGYFRKKRAA